MLPAAPRRGWSREVSGLVPEPHLAVKQLVSGTNPAIDVPHCGCNVLPWEDCVGSRLCAGQRRMNIDGTAPLQLRQRQFAIEVRRTWDLEVRRGTL